MNEEDPIKNEGTVWSQHYPSIFKMLKGSYLIGDGILKKYKLIQAFIAVLLNCKNEEEQFKNESTRLVTTDLPL